MSLRFPAGSRSVSVFRFDDFLEMGFLPGGVAISFEHPYWKHLGDWIDDPIWFFGVIDRLALLLANGAPPRKRLFADKLHPDSSHRFSVATQRFSYKRVIHEGWRNDLASFILTHNKRYHLFVGTLGHNCGDLVKSALQEVCGRGTIFFYITHSKVLAQELGECDSAVQEILELLGRYGGILVLADEDSDLF